MWEESSATGIDGDQTDNSQIRAGAVYVFTHNGTNWAQQAYIKAGSTVGSNQFGDNFGSVLSLSDDGNTLAVGAYHEDSNATGINGDQTNNSVPQSGAVYVFTRNGSTWSQQAYIKASNADADDWFGVSLSLSGDGNTLAVGAHGEESNATGINGGQTNNQSGGAGAVYVFTRSGTTWSQQAYVKASNTHLFTIAVGPDRFGYAVSLSDDGNTLAVGAEGEDSDATGINGDQGNPGFDSRESGAVYVFTRGGTIWSQQAYVKASNTDREDGFGESVNLSGDGNTMAVGATGEDGNATDAGAVYVFTRSGNAWSQQAYIKAINADEDDWFGGSVSLSSDGRTLAVGAPHEDSNAIGIGGGQADNSLSNAGAVYLYKSDGINWTQQAYIKSSNTGGGDLFGNSDFFAPRGPGLSLSDDGNTLAVGAMWEDGVAINAGAVYLY